MDEVFCAQSAFKFYRTPPQVLMGKTSIRQIFGYPTHTLIQSRSEHFSSDQKKMHLWTGELPLGALVEIPGVGTITSPLMTLFTMATAFGKVELALAMYEFCGEFSIYEPSDEEEASCSTSPLGAWDRVIDAAGRPTSLWMRPFLISLDELLPFAQSLKGRRGYRTFLDAAKMVLGVCRSPFEVQAAMLLGLPRKLGGYGFDLRTNEQLNLTRQARRIAQRGYCVADLYVASKDGTCAVDVECQGAAVHSSLGAAAPDADRTTALEAMGVDVVLLSYAQIADPMRLATVAGLMAAKLGEALRPKTARMVMAESDLRRRIFIDWRTLCDQTNAK